MANLSYRSIYLNYCQSRVPGYATPSWMERQLNETPWESPESPLDCNNYAVLALIEAEQTDDVALRSMYLDTAIAALTPFAETHLLCAAHLALIYTLIGDGDSATQLGFASFITQLPFAYAQANQLPVDLGLVYLPRQCQGAIDAGYPELQTVLEATDGNQQALMLLGLVLQRSQPIFYNPSGLRFLQLAAPLVPNSATLRLKLGVSNLLNGRWEGLLDLHRAQQLHPQQPTLMQALYLAYSDLQQPEIAQTWLAQAQQQVGSYYSASRWAEAPSSVVFTYVPFAGAILAVEPSFRSIVTSVLIAEGQWFEAEMEFWQDQIQPGMVVIDVGANVGVYTLTAAQRVGSAGRVVAVEPFSGCVTCLAETCRINGLDWVTICRAAASDRIGTVRLSLQTASELNEILTDEAMADESPPDGEGALSGDTELGSTETVPCLTLDFLMTQEKLHRVDLLKIDAEGHEINVLKGCDHLLRDYAPMILYENIAKGQANNVAVAEYLLAHGYRLFIYQPYIKQLQAIDSLDALPSSLNIIAIPSAAL
jgi:FkbM family methyltransferase